MWFMEEPSQFSMGQTAPSLTFSIMEEPHTYRVGTLSDNSTVMLYKKNVCSVAVVGSAEWRVSQQRRRRRRR